MKKGLKIVGIAVVVLAVFVLPAFWATTAEINGEFISKVRISPILTSVVLALGIYLMGGWRKKNEALSLLPAALLGWAVALVSKTPLWGTVQSTSWFRATPLTLLLIAFLTMEIIRGFIEIREQKFDGKTCLISVLMLICSILPVLAYVIRDGIYASMSASAGTHAGQILFSRVLIEIFCIAGGLAIIPFVQRNGDRITGAALVVIGGIGIVLHEFVLWSGRYDLLGRLYAAVQDPLALTIFAALVVAGICMMLRKGSTLDKNGEKG